jgi:hypothetical protein
MLRNGSGERRLALPGEWNAGVGLAPAPVRLIAVVERVPGAAWDVRPVPQSEGLLALLRNTPHVLAESTGIIALLRAAVSGSVCYAGVRGEAAECAGRVLELVARLP